MSDVCSDNHREAVEQMHNFSAHIVQSVPASERFGGKPVTGRRETLDQDNIFIVPFVFARLFS